MAFPTSLDSFQRKANKTGVVVQADNTTLYATGSATLGDYNDLEVALEAVEAKLGIDSSGTATSIDYLLRNTLSLDPGHRHTKVWASDGSTIAILSNAGADTLINQNAYVNANSNVQAWGAFTRNTGVFVDGSASSLLYGMFLGNDNIAYGTALISTSFNPYVLVGYHNANYTPQMNQIGYGLRFQSDLASIYWAIGTPGTPPNGVGTAPNWSQEPRLYLQPIVGGSGDTYSARMNLRAAHLRIGPQDSTVRYGYSGSLSSLLVLERSGDANDAAILFKSYSPNQTYWSFECPGTQHLHVKMVTGTHNPYAEIFTSALWFKYNTTPVPPLCSIGTDVGVTPLGQLYVRQGATGTISLYVDTLSSPSVDIAQFSNNGTVAFGLQNTGRLNFGTAPTTTTAPGAGGAGALPATPAGYMTIQVAGVDKKIAYY